MGRYNISNVDKTTSICMFTFFESRYIFNNQTVKDSAQCGV